MCVSASSAAGPEASAARERLEVDGAVGAVGQQLHDDAAVALEREELQRAAHVARARDEHAVAGREPQRVHGALPADRRALGERDLVRLRADEPRGERRRRRRAAARAALDAS